MFHINLLQKNIDIKKIVKTKYFSLITNLIKSTYIYLTYYVVVSI